MNDLLPAASGLPNLHPAVVHFPLALLPVAILFDLLLFAAPKSAWLDRAAAALYALAAAGAFAAVRAGEAAEATLGPLAGEVHDLFEQHEKLGERSLYALAALAAMRALLTWRDLRSDVVPRDFLRFVLLASGCGALVLLASTADLGGRLVYRHGVAVSVPMLVAEPAVAAPALVSPAAPALEPAQEPAGAAAPPASVDRP